MLSRTASCTLADYRVAQADLLEVELHSIASTCHISSAKVVKRSRELQRAGRKWCAGDGGVGERNGSCDRGPER